MLFQMDYHFQVKFQQTTVLPVSELETNALFNLVGVLRFTKGNGRERPFPSARAKNASRITSSGTTHRDRTVRGDSKPAHIFARFATRQTLRGISPESSSAAPTSRRAVGAEISARQEWNELNSSAQIMRI
jgi:hypothetical protein